MRSRRWSLLLLGTLTLLAALADGLGPAQARPADDPQPPGPDRYTTLVVAYTSYDWWLVNWSGGLICEIIIDHEGLPTPGDVYNACGEDLYDEWRLQKACPDDVFEQDPSACSGYYLQFMDTAPAEREIGVTLPAPQVWATVSGCEPIPNMPTYLCDDPTLVLTGEEPLPNETILRIEGTLDGESFTCESPCSLKIRPTVAGTSTVRFWAFSSYGDSSVAFEALVRVTPSKMDSSTDEMLWYMDVLSRQWKGVPLASCSQSWESFPPVEGLPSWLITPADPGDLASDIPYVYLAGNLINQGVVDASSCPDKGLLPGGGASPCGLSVAEPEVVAWQNRFDQLILDVARETSVPAQLLKNLFGRESQFWPGIITSYKEVGLGQMTENGADTALMWNPSFYDQFCPLVLAQDTCDLGYLHLSAKNQAKLRGAMVQRADATCPECPLGLDLSQADFSISLFAHTLLGSCEQTGQVVYNLTHSTPGNVASYEDLWKFTLVNYNAGPGCLYAAMQLVSKKHQDLNWENVSAQLSPACQGAVDYVRTISADPP